LIRRIVMMKAAALRITVLMGIISSAAMFIPAVAPGYPSAGGNRYVDDPIPQGSGEMPLSQQLEGLGPLPRLAYLRHLLEQGRADAEVMFQTAVAFHELGETDSALYYYDRTIAIDPNDFKSYVNKGVIYDEAGDYARAIQSFAMGATLNPEDVLAHSHLAFLLHQKGDNRAAWEHLHAALEIDPDHPQPHFYLAIFFWDARIFREAMREWETVIDLEPDGFLAMKARDNIVMLQKALESPSPDGDWSPER
jgi:Flp pilus assembly protein TadD